MLLRVPIKGSYLRVAIKGSGLGFRAKDCVRGLYGFRARGIPKTPISLSQGIWVVVKIMVPFCVPIIIWQLLLRVPKKGP